MLWWLSNLLVLLGAALYSQVRGQEMKEKHERDKQAKLASNNEAGETKVAMNELLDSSSSLSANKLVDKDSEKE